MVKMMATARAGWASPWSHGRLAKALDELRNRKAGWLCCLSEYNGDGNIARAAEELHNKVATIKANFKLSIDVGGSADLSGKTSVTMDVSANDSFQTTSFVSHPPGPPSYMS